MKDIPINEESNIFYDAIKPESKGKKSSGYKRMHEAANNRVMPIHSMNNNHIENFINLMIEKMESIKSQALYEVGESGDLFNEGLNNVQKMDKNEAYAIISNIMYKLEPYLTELVIRGNVRYISNVSEKFTSILNRKTISGHDLLQ
ncbi:MAG: hypothetical protein WD512_17915 [Candidatus Paceibacterota bacterium]